MTEADLPKPNLVGGAAFNVAHQYFAAALAVVHGLVLVPLYLAKIPVDLYGAWLATGGVLAWIDLIDPGLSGALQQRVAARHGANDALGLSETVGTGIALSVALSVIALVSLPFGHLVPRVIGITGANAETLILCFDLGVVATAVAFASYAMSSILTGLHSSAVASFIFSGSALAGLATTVTLLLLDFGLPAVPIGLLVKSLLVLIGDGIALAIWWKRRGLRPPRFARDEYGQMTSLLGYTFAARLGGVLLDRMEALVVSVAFSPSLAVVYVLTGRPFEPLRMVTTRLAYGLAPSLAHLRGAREYGHLRAVVDKTFSLVGLVAVAGAATLIALNQAFVSLWVGSSFFGGLKLTVALGAATLVLILGTTANHFVFALGGIRRASGLSLVEGILRMTLVVLAIRWIGIISLPLATCVAGAAVSYRYLPRALAALLEQGDGQAATWRRTLVIGTGLGLLGLTFACCSPLAGRTWGWPSLGVAVALGGSVFLLLGFAANRLLGAGPWVFSSRTDDTL